MVSVGVNPPKTPVTEGSMDMAPATLPNVCKMPGPPAPFVPVPLPNFGRSADRLAKATKKVKIDGKKVAIKGSYYMSQPSPDVASQGTGGGIVSAKVQGKTEFVAPGSMNVKAEGKNIQLLGDAMTNNGGSPANSGTVPGNQQAPKPKKPWHKCGEVGGYGKQCRTGRAKGKWERDHVPSKAALKRAAEKGRPKVTDPAAMKRVMACVEARGIAIVIPKRYHRKFSRTCGSKKNTPAQINNDAKDLKKAAEKDLRAMTKALKGHSCEAAYKKAAKEVRKFDHKAMIKKCKKDCQ